MVRIDATWDFALRGSNSSSMTSRREHPRAKTAVVAVDKGTPVTDSSYQLLTALIHVDVNLYTAVTRLPHNPTFPQ